MKIVCLKSVFFSKFELQEIKLIFFPSIVLSSRASERQLRNFERFPHFRPNGQNVQFGVPTGPTNLTKIPTTVPTNVFSDFLWEN